MMPSARLAWATHVVGNREFHGGGSVRVAVILADMMNGQTGQLNPSVATLAERTGLTERAVRIVLQELTTAGYVAKED